MSKLKMKRLLLQHDFLEAEEKEIMTAINNSEKPLREYIVKHFPEQAKQLFQKPPIQEPVTQNQNTETNEEISEEEVENKETDPETEIIKESPASEPPNELRPLYKKIIAFTHPDKTNDEKKWPLFMDAAEAYSSKNLGKLIQIALKCDIDIEEYINNEDYISIIEDNVKNMNTYNSFQKNTFAWKWHESTSDDEKRVLVQQLFQTKGIVFNTEEV